LWRFFIPAKGPMGGNDYNSYYLYIRYLPLISFSTVPGSNESDLRTLYCAFAISSVLNDWSGVDIARGIAFIATCRVIYLFLTYQAVSFTQNLSRLTKEDMGSPLFVKHKVG
jgi:hypothetical protein